MVPMSSPRPARTAASGWAGVQPRRRGRASSWTVGAGGTFLGHELASPGVHQGDSHSAEKGWGFSWSSSSLCSLWAPPGWWGGKGMSPGWMCVPLAGGRLWGHLCRRDQEVLWRDRTKHLLGGSRVLFETVLSVPLCALSKDSLVSLWELSRCPPLRSVQDVPASTRYLGAPR